jgi:signal transduction histidine kinase
MIVDLEIACAEPVTLLITDDDAGDRRQIVRALQQTELSYDYCEVSSIEEALAACEQRSFDCAIIDYQLPGNDGLDGVAALHRRFPYMFIVMATGHGNATIATEAMKRGASDYIAKKNISGKSLGRILQNARQKELTRRKLAQQREELERFADVLAHDLKSPIASIRGFATIISQAVQSGTTDPVKIAGYCDRVVKLSERMVALVDTLHEYTKVDAHVDFEPVDLNRVMENARSNLEQVIAKRGAVVSQDDLPVVFGHASLMEQLLQNLIGNGIKYCEAETPTVHVSASAVAEIGWRVAVCDNGIGIDAKFHQQIFEPFKRLHDRGKYEGSGLGLATCRKIIERLDGRIWCESNEAGGTTFYVSLPAI